MSEPAVLRFGLCEVNLLQREVSVGGVLQPVPLKAYELLVLLLRQRHRVMPKRELTDVLWPNADVSDNVVSRTVMQARRAIHDSAEQPQWIRTIHGIGYRFAGEVFELNAEAVAPTATPPKIQADTGPAQRRIGVLPCDNLSGDCSLDWTQVGLMALVGHALEADKRLVVTPMRAMREAVGTLSSAASVDDRAGCALRSLNLQHVSHAVIRRQGQALWLEYKIFCAGRPALNGSLRDADPVALGMRLARTIEATLFPGREVPVAFESKDAFVNQSFARAIELYEQGQWRSAARHLAVVCDMEPHSTAAALWHLHALSMAREPAVLETGEALQSHAATPGDAALQNDLPQAIGQASPPTAAAATAGTALPES